MQPDVIREEIEWRPAAAPLCAFQGNWRTPTWFVQCPEVVCDNALDEYLSRLVPGAVFTSNVYGESVVIAAALGVNGVLSVVNGDPTPLHPAGQCSIWIEDGAVLHAGGVYFLVADAMQVHSWAIGSHDVYRRW